MSWDAHALQADIADLFSDLSVPDCDPQWFLILHTYGGYGPTKHAAQTRYRATRKGRAAASRYEAERREARRLARLNKAPARTEAERIEAKRAARARWNARRSAARAALRSAAPT